jgi:hypothetical protein
MAKNQALKWRFNLEKAPQKENLKDPLGYKQNINEIMVRSSGKKNLT